MTTIAMLGSVVTSRIPDNPTSTSSILPAAFGLLLGNASTTIFIVMSATVRQSATPDRLLAPVLSLYYALAMSAVAVGGLAGGIVGARLGPGGAITVASVVLVISGLLGVTRRLGPIEAYRNQFLDNMAIFHSRRQITALAVPQNAGPGLLGRARTSGAVVNPTRCTHTGCPDSRIARCAYIDRNGDQCTTFWCSTHASVLDDATVCRRHKNLILDLALDLADISRHPALDSGAPGLLVWVRRGIDAPIREVLTDRFPAEQGYTLAAEPPTVRYAADGPVWTCTWSVADPAGTPRVTIGFAISESADKFVRVFVNGRMRTQVLASWIVRRQLGARSSPVVDAGEREQFYRQLLDVVVAALDDGK